jgi:hypothetical protein
LKGKVLSFPFIYFSESGLFKGLHGIQIKKSFCLMPLADPPTRHPSFPRQASRPSLQRREVKLACASLFCNKLQIFRIPVDAAAAAIASFEDQDGGDESSAA